MLYSKKIIQALVQESFISQIFIAWEKIGHVFVSFLGTRASKSNCGCVAVASKRLNLCNSWWADIFVEAFLQCKGRARRKTERIWICFGVVSQKRQQHADTTRVSRVSTMYASNLGWICANCLTWTNVKINREQEFLGRSYKPRTSPNIKSSTRASWHMGTLKSSFSDHWLPWEPDPSRPRAN